MEYKGATIQRIKEIVPIPGCDNIELAKVLGWQCIVKKGEFKVGDSCVYIEIDSLLPIKPEYEFLRKNCYKKLPDGSEWFRIKTIKMKGQLSQGLVLHADIVPYDEQADVSKYLGVKHYEKPTPGANLSGEAKGNFPVFLTKTDETCIQSVPELIDALKGKPYYITTKLDGTSATYYIKDGQFGVCSRNLELKESESNVYWQIARKYKIEESLRRAAAISKEDLCIQGEIVGAGIQKNPMNLADKQFFVFNIRSITEGVKYSLNYITRLAQLFDLTPVPIEEAGQYFNCTVDQLLEKSKGKYTGTDHNKEGIVVRAADQSISFKVVNNDYLLKEE